jgi:hypothetical protein
MISATFIIGMIYFYYMTDKSVIVNQYKSSLSPELQQRYDKITNERLTISCQGYVLGLILSMGFIFYNLKIKHEKMGTTGLVCSVLAISFITNYFYYMIHPKSDWMLNHVENKEEVKAWTQMYREMQYNYHMGLVLGIIGVGIFAFAFRS